MARSLGLANAELRETMCEVAAQWRRLAADAEARDTNPRKRVASYRDWTMQVDPRWYYAEASSSPHASKGTFRWKIIPWPTNLPSSISFGIEPDRPALKRNGL
jgi:hypothetical protein